MKQSGHPLIVVVEYLFKYISTHSETNVLIDLEIHSPASRGTIGPLCDLFPLQHFIRSCYTSLTLAAVEISDCS